MEKKKLWYLEERAEQLAIVYLTRRDDLVITRHAGPDDGLNLLVTLTNRGESAGRLFGVQVKGLSSLAKLPRLTSSTDATRFETKKTALPKDIPFPLVLFVFVMEDDSGYYKWLKRPNYGFDGQPRLMIEKANGLEKLDNAAIAGIIEEINHWYENKSKVPA